MAERRRVLLAILVYGGQDVVPACLASAVRQRADSYGIDVLVLDDCSPDETWSRELDGLCQRSGARYHRHARNLGISRNMTVAMLAGTEGYDHVVLCNSDVVLGLGVVERLATVADSDDTIGSVTAWSNNVSIFSLTRAPGDASPGQAQVDLLDETLAEHFGHEALPIPVGVGFCLLVPVRAIAHVGVMDPIFGRGYCEEVDWCLRASELGLRHVLALGGFAFHHGSVSTRAAGMVGPEATTEWAHEAIIDRRYPGYRELVDDFVRTTTLEAVRDRAASTLVHRFLLEGWDLTVGRVGHGGVEVLVDPRSGAGRALALGFEIETQGATELDELVRWCGRHPDRVHVLDRGKVGDSVAAWATANGLDDVALAPYRFSI